MTEPIRGLMRGQEGVAIAWRYAAGPLDGYPQIKWVGAVALRPGQRCLEIGWASSAADTSAAVDRLCYNRHDGSLPTHPASGTDSPPEGVSARIFGQPDADSWTRSAPGYAPLSQRSLPERVSRMARLASRIFLDN